MMSLSQAERLDTTAQRSPRSIPALLHWYSFVTPVAPLGKAKFSFQPIFTQTKHIQLKWIYADTGEVIYVT